MSPTAKVVVFEASVHPLHHSYIALICQPLLLLIHFLRPFEAKLASLALNLCLRKGVRIIFEYVTWSEYKLKQELVTIVSKFLNDSMSTTIWTVFGKNRGITEQDLL